MCFIFQMLSGLWTSSTVNQCRNTYVLNEGLGDIFGSGSLFSLSGTTLTTSIRVSATSEITEDGSTFERSYSEDIPILVNFFYQSCTTNIYYQFEDAKF